MIMNEPNKTFRNVFNQVRSKGTLEQNKPGNDNWHVDTWKFYHVKALLMDSGYTKKIVIDGVLDVMETYNNTYIFIKGNQETLENTGV